MESDTYANGVRGLDYFLPYFYCTELRKLRCHVFCLCFQLFSYKRT